MGKSIAANSKATPRTPPFRRVSAPRAGPRGSALGAGSSTSSSARRYASAASVAAPEASQQVGAGRVEQVVRVELVRPARRRAARPASGTVGHRDGDRPVELDHRRRVAARRARCRARRSAASRCPRAAAPGRGARRSRPAADTGPARRSVDRTVERRAGPRRSCRGPTASGPGPRAAPGRRPDRPGRRGASAAGASARAGRAPRARRGAGGRRRGPARSPRRTDPRGPAHRSWRVALVEDQVEDGEHAGEPFRQELASAARGTGSPACADLALRPHEPLGDRGLGREERPRDLAGRQAADGAERERDPRVERRAPGDST